MYKLQRGLNIDKIRVLENIIIGEISETHRRPRCLMKTDKSTRAINCKSKKESQPILF